LLGGVDLTYAHKKSLSFLKGFHLNMAATVFYPAAGLSSRSANGGSAVLPAMRGLAPLEE